MADPHRLLNTDSPPGRHPVHLPLGSWVWSLWLVVPMLVLLAAVLAAGLVTRAYQSASIQQASAQQSDETELLARLIGSKIEQSQKALATVAEAAAPWALDSRPSMEWLLNQGLPAARYFDSLVFARGTEVYRLHFRSGADATTDVEPAERDLLRRVIVDGKPQVSDPVKSSLGGPSIAFGMPLRDKDGTVQGAMAGVLRLQSQSLLPVSLSVSAHDNAQLVVMSANGVLISHAEPGRILGMAVDEPALAQALALWQERSAGAAAAAVKPIVQTWWREPQFLSVAEIPSARWLVVRVVERDLTLPLMGRQWQLWWWLLAVPMVLAALTWLWLWWHTRRLRELVAHMLLPDDAEPSDEIAQMAQYVQGLRAQNAAQARLLLQQDQLAEGVLEKARFAFLLLENERIAQVSQALAHLLGYSRADLQGQSVHMLAMNRDDLAQRWSTLAPDLQRHGSAEVSLDLRHQSGAPIMATVQLVRVDGVSPGFVWCFVRAGQGRVASQAVDRVDKLTQLPNFEGLCLHLNAMLQAQREGLDGPSPSAPVLFYVNVDNMSSINALAGHAQGDAVLQQVARQLQLLQPFQGFAARVAGDKFALVLRQCSRDKAGELAEQLCEALQNWQPELRGKHFMVTVSIGLLPIEPGFDDAQHIIRAADLACYAAKRQGGNCVHWSDALAQGSRA